MKNSLLKDEQSLFLTRSSDELVQWHSYGPEAIQKAKDENKPIFLSIGYSSSHWCHVMSNEAFRVEEIAKQLNENFINIKVDREEHPDIDSYYQLACQIMNGRGGWPLNSFLTPDLKPYFIGTYFPAIPQEGIPSFKEVVTNLSKAYTEEKDAVLQNANQLISTLSAPPQVEHRVEFEGHYPNAASVLNALKEYQDNDHAGYGVEPKFAHYSFLEWAVEHTLEGMVPKEYADHILKTVESILFGGLYDQARGGVHRYCLDQKWQVPHFEKMLYDQAGLLKVLSKASLIYPSPAVFDGIINTLNYLKSEMLSDQGFFFAAQDSDSEGEQGLYFAFTQDEFLDALMEFDESLMDESEKYIEWFNITEKGDLPGGLNIPSLNLAKQQEIYSPEGWSTVRKIKQALFDARKQRIPPVTDNKGVASWNFFLGAALMDVIQYTKIESIHHAATDLLNASLESIHKEFLFLDEKERTQIKTTTTRENHVPLFEDYVCFAEFSLRLYEIFGKENFYNNGISTIEFIFKEFYGERGFLTRAYSHSDTEEYANIHTSIFDQSYRSSLGVYLGLLRKWRISEEDFSEYLEKVDKSVETLTHLSLQNPLAFGETLRALVYPDDAYRMIKVPKRWLENKSIMPFFPNFSARFALKYTDDENDNWEIRTIKECELKGSTFEEFKNVFTPQRNEDE